MTSKITSYVGWAIVLSASAYFIFDNALPYFGFQRARFEGGGYWPNFAPWLMFHIVGGLTALVLGPFQFIPSIRKNYPRTHKLIGKIYLCAITLAALASLNISVFKIIVRQKAIMYGAGLFMLAIVWLITSGMAYWSVRSRNFVQHREWMVRSFVVTCAFTTFRLIDKMLVKNFGIDGSVSAELMAWACWSVPVIVTELFLQGSKIRKGNIALANKKKQAIAVVPDMDK